MKIKGLLDEDFVNYKKPSMFIATSTCTFKCDKEYGSSICQNGCLVKQPTMDVDDNFIVDRYKNNAITKAIVIGGLEPFDDIDEVINLIHVFRNNGINDDIVIYTGYNKEELHCIDQIKQYKNIIIKYGRYIPNQKQHIDPVLDVSLSSDNQYAEKIC